MIDILRHIKWTNIWCSIPHYPSALLTEVSIQLHKQHRDADSDNDLQSRPLVHNGQQTSWIFSYDKR